MTKARIQVAAASKNPLHQSRKLEFYGPIPHVRSPDKQALLAVIKDEAKLAALLPDHDTLRDVLVGNKQDTEFCAQLMLGITAFPALFSRLIHTRNSVIFYRD